MSNDKTISSLVQLLTTAGCHLCEQPLAWLEQTQLSQPVILECIDIAEDDTLIATYGCRIPVLRRINTCGQWDELGWPFSAEQLRVWLEKGLENAR